jgi:hypothetical protein
LTGSSALDIECNRSTDFWVVLAAVKPVQIVQAVQAVQNDRKLSESIEQLGRLEPYYRRNKEENQNEV